MSSSKVSNAGEVNTESVTCETSDILSCGALSAPFPFQRELSQTGLLLQVELTAKPQLFNYDPCSFRAVDLVTAVGSKEGLGYNNPRHGPFHQIIYYNNRQLPNEGGFNDTGALYVWVCVCVWTQKKQTKEQKKKKTDYDALYGSAHTSAVNKFVMVHVWDSACDL